MDLPTNRIPYSDMTMRDNGDIEFHEPGQRDPFLRITDRVKAGRYVIAINFEVDGETCRKLMAIETTREFATLNRLNLLQVLQNKMGESNLNVVDIALLYQDDSTWMLGNLPIEINKDRQTNDHLYNHLQAA